MHFYFAFIFFLAFSILNNALELSDRTALQDIYDRTYHPTDDEKYSFDGKNAFDGIKILFDHAKLKLTNNPHDENYKLIMGVLATQETPFMPAIRWQVNRALVDKRYKTAWHFADIGSKKGDLSCMFSKASFLLNPDQFFCTSEYDPLEAELEGQQLLAQAAQEVAIPGLKTRKYFLPEAREYLKELENQGTDRLKSAFEASLNKKNKEALAEAEKNAKEKNSFLNGCYFIKKYIHGDHRLDIPNAPAHVIDWTQRIIGSTDFDYEEFKKSGAYDALESLAVCTEHPEHTHASLLLGWIDYRRLSDGQAVEIEKLERNLEVGSAIDPRALLLLASYASNPDDLVEYADRIVKRLDDMDKSLYMTATPDLISLYYVLMQKNAKKFDKGLIRVIKHKAFKDIQDELCKDADLAGQLGVKLLKMRDAIVEKAKTKDRADHRKIHDAGLALTTAAADGLNDHAAWALVEHSLHAAATEGQKSKLDEYVAHAIMTTQARLEAGMPLLVNSSELLLTLKQLEVTTALSSDSCYALAHWYLNGVPNMLERDECKAVEYLAKTSNPVPVLVEAQNEEKINAPAACLQAGILMHKNTATALARNFYFGKAIVCGSFQEIKAAADYCIQHKELVPLACNALAQLYDLLSKEESGTEAYTLRDKAVKSVVSELMKWALGTHYTQDPEKVVAADRHPAAIMFFNEPLVLSSVKKEDRDVFEMLAEWAALAGYPEAIEAVEAKFKTCKKEVFAIAKAVDYWKAWKKLFERNPQKSEQVKEVNERLRTLSDYALEAGEKDPLLVPSPRTQYRLANMFMESDPVRAVNHILLIETFLQEHMIRLPQSAAIINEEETFELLRAKAAQGIDWACYALACVELNRLELFVENHKENHKICFAEVDKIKDLLEKAKTFDIKQLDARLRKEKRTDKGRAILTLAEIEYRASSMACTLNKISDKADEVTATRGAAELVAAMQKEYPEALFSWATGALQGGFGKGQETLEKGIAALCKSFELGIERSGERLTAIYEGGYGYLCPCAGHITKQIRDQIAKTLVIGGRALPKPKPKTGTPENAEFDQALADLDNTAQVPRALSVFQKLSDAGDVRGHVYLGVMHRDAMGVEKSEQKAREYFVCALKESAGKRMDRSFLDTLNIAYEGTRTMVAGNLSLAVDRARYNLQSMVPDQYDFYLHDALDEVEALERLLTQSSDPTICNLLYNSGLMQELVSVCVSTNSLKHRMRIAKMCLKRCLKVDPSTITKTSKEIAENKNITSNFARLILPIAYVRDSLAEGAMGMNSRELIFSTLKAEEVDEFMSLLKQAVSRGYLIPFEELLGTLRFSYGLVLPDKGLIKEGMKNWEAAEKNGDQRAAYMWALAKLRGNKIGKRKRVISTLQGNKIVLERLISHEPKVGLEKVKALASARYVSAYQLLANHYLENDNAKEALPWYRKMRIEQPSNVPCALGFIETMARLFDKTDEEDKRRIGAAFETIHASGNPENQAMGAFIASYFRLIKKLGGITDEQALDYINNNAGSFLGVAKKNKQLYRFLKDTQFAKKFAEWLNALPPISSDVPGAVPTISIDFRIKAHMAHMYLLFINYTPTQDENTAYKAIIDECDKILKLKPDSLEAEGIKAMIYYANGLRGDEEAIKNMKRSVINCTFTLKQKNLKLDAAPTLNALLHTIQHQGATAGSLRSDGCIVNTVKTLEQVSRDTAWAKKLIETYQKEEKKAA